MRRLWLPAACAPAMALAAPAEPPPEGYAAARYVDSGGCAFARVDLGGRVIWAEQIGPDGRPVCGLTPSEAASAAPAPARQPVFPLPGYYVQVAAFRDAAEAGEASRALQSRGWGTARQDLRRSRGALRVVYAGPFAGRRAAAAALSDIRGELGYSDAFLRRQD